ncbi:hypothetical protein [Photobacterium lipolyticum]|uniref:Uncharacterized protein n=1 Tax=Photobacterium lipolyticum TaxID=266810 RepID=A0A2T3N162_9GAMM|nr:hypothetical protein [Photobacterium lipolyticum]PSW06067.1 hypothetical protein C9I89_06015 [Photobacterium lipolyticum]
MAFSIKKTVLISVGLALLSGCVSIPADRDGRMTALAKDARSLAADYPDAQYSEPMQLMYTIHGTKPERHNDLDGFNAFDYHDPNSVQSALQVGTVASTFGNPFAMLTRTSLIEIMKTAPSKSLQSNRLVIMVPSSGNIKADADKIYELKLAMIKRAYVRAGASSVSTHFVEGNTDGLSSFSPAYLIPDGLKHCDLSNVNLDNIGGYQRKSCAAMILNGGSLYFNNSDDKLAPKGDFLVSSSWLPDNFPVEHLSTDSDFTYLYMPTVLWNQSGVYADIPAEDLSALYAKHRFSLNPLVKNLKSGEVMYFNQKLSNNQPSPTELVDEKKVFLSKQ